ncbi:hypothetical protein [uncultured Mailhella sp.]|uniref:hypothetical protein n=1 Tax=uncultured Mailhella sp. TaxID=1981031 RepID=UPI002604C9FD|nr:hypothetical protein [uncultured Mailhella sp.]
MRKISREREAAKLLAVTLSNFSAISFGIGIFENSIIGLLLGSYSLVLALAIMWRVSE